MPSQQKKVKVQKAKVPKVKVQKAKVPKVKVQKAKASKAKIPKVKVQKAKASKAKVLKVKVQKPIKIKFLSFRAGIFFYEPEPSDDHKSRVLVARVHGGGLDADFEAYRDDLLFTSKEWEVDEKIRVLVDYKNKEMCVRKLRDKYVEHQMKKTGSKLSTDFLFMEDSFYHVRNIRREEDKVHCPGDIPILLFPFDCQNIGYSPVIEQMFERTAEQKLNSLNVVGCTEIPQVADKNTIYVQMGSCEGERKIISVKSRKQLFRDLEGNLDFTRASVKKLYDIPYAEITVDSGLQRQDVRNDGSDMFVDKK